MKLIHFVIFTVSILMVLLASSTPAGAYMMHCPSELRQPCDNESPCIGCLAQAVEQLRSVPTTEMSGKAELAMDGPPRKAKLARRTVAILRFLVCTIRELSRELIKNIFSIETRR